MGIVFDMLSGNLFPFRVESTMIHPPFCPNPPNRSTRKDQLPWKLKAFDKALYFTVTGEECHVEVKPGGTEGEVVGVSVCGLEVTRGVEPRGVPEAAT